MAWQHVIFQESMDHLPHARCSHSAVGLRPTSSSIECSQLKSCALPKTTAGEFAMARRRSPRSSVTKINAGCSKARKVMTPGPSFCNPLKRLTERSRWASLKAMRWEVSPSLGSPHDFRKASRRWRSALPGTARCRVAAMIGRGRLPWSTSCIASCALKGLGTCA
eukprot:scaffold141807_cov32-Tisochrysis_lutea.AAC.5